MEYLAVAASSYRPEGLDVHVCQPLVGAKLLSLSSRGKPNPRWQDWRADLLSKQPERHLEPIQPETKTPYRPTRKAAGVVSGTPH